jgi:3-keto-disaccharide hydrolase
MRWKLLAFVIVVGFFASTAFAQNDQWLPNDTRRPLPTVVTPSAQPGGAPSDAVVLFDGKNTDAWEGVDGKSARWKVEDGDMVIAPGTGNLRTRQAFGDCQLHVELMEPNPPRGNDQGRGNSGIIIEGLYEVQVLDSYHNTTYADGSAGALYAQYPPLVNASRQPGVWQTYDIIFRRPRFDATGHLLSPARFTVFMNGILVQDDTQPTGPTAFHDRPPYMPVPEKLPLELQDHGQAVRFRNIWIRDLPDPAPSLHYTAAVPVAVDPQEMASYAGRYGLGQYGNIEIRVNGKTLMAQTPRFMGGLRAFRGFRGTAGARGTPALRGMRGPFPPPPSVQLVPIDHDVFVGEYSGSSMRITFTRNGDGQVSGLTIQSADVYRYAPKVQ